MQSTRPEFSKHWLLLLALLSALGPLSIDLYLPALPAMAQDLSTTTAMVSNSLPAYFLGLALGQLVYGPLSDRIGRKPPLYFGLSVYILASLLCVYADSAWQLIIARVLQALGGCVGVVIARAAIRDRYDLDAAAQAFAQMMMVVTIAPIMAPALGALILHFLPWQALFIVLMLTGIISLIYVHFGFSESLPIERRLQLNFNQVLQLYAAVLRDLNFIWPMLIGACSSGVMFCYISASAEVLMDGYGLSEAVFSYVFGLNAVGILIFSTLNKYLAQHTALRRLTMGCWVQSTGIGLLLICAVIKAPLMLVLVGLFFTVAGIGLVGPNAMALAMSKQGSRAGTASAVMGSMQFFCGLLAGALLNLLFWQPLLNMAVLMVLMISLVHFSTAQYRKTI